jgi:hypothetical protein
MNESNLTPFTIKNINRPNTASLSKLGTNHLIQKSKPDYFHILNQIKEKTKKFNMDNSTLFNKYWHNNTQKVINNKYKYKLYRNNTPNSLITETLYNMKQFSYRNIPTSDRLFNKNKLILKQNYNSPKKLINEIIKIEDSKKIITKNKLFEKRNPKVICRNYKEYLDKANVYSFCQYQNANTDFAHQIRSKYFIKRLDESLSKESERNKKYLIIEKERLENEKEMRDEVFYPSLDMQKISKQIKLILANEYKFNNFEKHEAFFDNFTNRINFLFDNFKPPYIKNNLINNRFGKENYENNNFEWKWLNALGINAINYLSRARIRIQRENDEKKKFLREKNKIKKRYIYYKKLSTNNIYNSKVQIEKIIYKNYYTQNNDMKKNLNLDEILEIQSFFSNKIEKYDKISISKDIKSRNFIFNNTLI